MRRRDGYDSTANRFAPRTNLHPHRRRWASGRVHRIRVGTGRAKSFTRGLILNSLARLKLTIDRTEQPAASNGLTTACAAETLSATRSVLGHSRSLLETVWTWRLDVTRCRHFYIHGCPTFLHLLQR